VTTGLEIDHVDGWALTRTTTVDRLARLCRWHHHLKTYCGYRLDGGPGDWHLVAPERPPADDQELPWAPEPGKAPEALPLDPGPATARSG
jgi:hypothetical protein